MLQVCTCRAKSLEDNVEQTVIIGVCVHDSRVCVFCQHTALFNLPEGSGGREDNLAFIKAF